MFEWFPLFKLIFDESFMSLRNRIPNQRKPFIAQLPLLSPGQMDRQVVASGRKLNLRKDSRWVEGETDSQVSFQVLDYLHWLIIGSWTSLTLRWLELCSQTKKVVEKVALKVSASHRKSTQVRSSAGQTESQVDPSSQLASTCDSVWSGLYSWGFTFWARIF